MNRKVRVWGELITCDHTYYNDICKMPGIGGNSYCLNVVDHFTKFAMSYPSPVMTSESIVYAFREYLGVQE